MQQFLTTSGDYVILSFGSSLDNIQKITGYTDNLNNTGSGTIFKKEFRYSFDNDTYSEFLELSPSVLSSQTWPENSKVWFQFRYTLLSGGPVIVQSVTLDYDIYPVNPLDGYVTPNKQDESKIYAFPITYKSGAKWNPYKLNKAVRLYKDLNLMANSLFGWDASYFRVLPQGRSKDVFLLEYSLYEHDAMQCVKLMVPNNQFPDNKMNMGPFGPDFEMPFEVQVDKDYFQAIFGEGSGPQKRDVIYFPITNRIYEVSSSYLFRDFMNEPLYFKMTLIKWLPKSNVETTIEIDALESLAPSVIEIFGKEQQDQETNIGNPDQFTQTTTTSDLVRLFVDQNVTITDMPVMNYYLQVAEYQYSLPASVKENLMKLKLEASIAANLTAGNLYYVRLPESQSVTTGVNDHYSVKILTYIDQDREGYSLFEMKEGFSIYSKDYPKWSVFGPTSSFYVYSTEFTKLTNETPTFICADYIAQSSQKPFVKYLATGDFPQNNDRSYSAWFNIGTNTRFSSKATRVTYDAHSLSANITYTNVHNFFVGDYISLRRSSGGNFNMIGTITQVLSSYQVVVTFDYNLISYVDRVFPSWPSYTDLNLQLTVPRVFIDDTYLGKGVRIDLLEKRHFRVFSNGNISYFSLPNTQAELSENTWYAICVTMSNTFSQMTLNVWGMQWDPATNLPATSNLDLLYGKTENNLPKVDRTTPVNYFITPSDMELTNIRVWDQKIESDKQPIILNQYVVKDASRAIVIDNAIPQSRLPYISYTH